MTEISLYDAAGADPHLLDALTGGWLWDPFMLLGAHPLEGRRVLRVFVPGVRRVEAIDPAGRWQAELQPTRKPGLFAGWLPESGAYRLRLHWSGGVQETEDPYAFPPQLSDFDLHLFAEGRHLELARCMGAQPRVIDGVEGVLFAVWAPNARRVSVVGDFNSWDGRRHPLRSRGGSGVWELFVPRVAVGALYKFELQGEHGLLPLKADPLALQAELAPSTASIVADPAPFAWSDGEWMAGRAARHRPEAPISVYELHAESWRHDADGKPLDWQGLAEQLIPYVCDMGFTHIELMPIMCHPFGGSWGYQPLGLFAPQASLGTPEQLAGFVDRCHAAGIGVILDWVPAHFPADEHGLARFDGTALYEHADPREGFHQDWNTLIYNFGRNEVRSFLLSSALHWLQTYHIDGLRVDAVASMLYRDYSRKDGEWVPNRYGGRENLEAISFLKELNVHVGQRCPGAMTIAEESTAWPAVSRPTEHGGLGFWFKWNMGWMNDTLRYIEKNPVHRAWEHHLLTFGLLYAFSENFMLPLSHDEVVHGKRSMLSKMPGDEWQRFANLRCYYAFMWSHPGKKLLFMGSELAEYDEWNHDRQLNWPLLQFPLHRGVQALVRELNRQYCSNESLHLADGTADGFRWVVGDDHANSVLGFCRMPGRGGRPLLAICNFTPVPRRRYRVGVPLAGGWKPILNTDAIEFGGSGMTIADHVQTEDRDAHGCEQSLMLDLPPLATLWLMPA